MNKFKGPFVGNFTFPEGIQKILVPYKLRIMRSSWSVWILVKGNVLQFENVLLHIPAEVISVRKVEVTSYVNRLNINKNINKITY